MKLKLSLTLASFCLLVSSSVFAKSAEKFIIKLENSSQKNGKLLAPFAQKGLVQEYKMSFGTYYLISSEKSLQDLKNSLHGRYEFIEKNSTYSISASIANPLEDLLEDSKATKQWGLFNSGKNSGNLIFSGKPREDINILGAWEKTKGSKKIKVGVIDTGIDYNHEDLKANMWTNALEAAGTPGVDDDGNGHIDDLHGYNFIDKSGDPLDNNGHGTHCSGVIGAAHNRLGVAGVMANVELVGLKFLGRYGSGEVINAALAFDYAIKMKLNVLSNSWGGPEDSALLRDAIIAAGKAGIVVVAAAGNSSQNIEGDPSYPANYNFEHVITVGSFKGTGAMSGFSNFSPELVHVFAPGSSILSTYMGNKYKSLSGTSMAAPFVSGIAGLMASYYLEKNGELLEPAKIKDLMISTSKETENLREYSLSGGRVDASAAIDAL